MLFKYKNKMFLVLKKFERVYKEYPYLLLGNLVYKICDNEPIYICIIKNKICYLIINNNSRTNNSSIIFNYEKNTKKILEAEINFDLPANFINDLIEKYGY